MPALYTHTTRANGTVLTAAIYNADHQNHIDNGIPASLDDYSISTTQMQSTVDPGEAGSESLATSLAGEIERLRFAIADAKKHLNGGSIPQWYSTPSGAYSGTTGSFSGAVTVGGTLTASSTLAVTGAATVGGSLTVSGAIGTVGPLTIAPAGNAGIEHGRTDGIASTPFIDFHSGATAVDHDSRIIASGGTGVTGEGTLAISAATITLGVTNITSSLVSTAANQRIKTLGTAISVPIFSAEVSADTFARFTIESHGLLSWGPGNADGDVDLGRDSAGVIGINSVANAALTRLALRPTTGTAVAIGADASQLILYGTSGANAEYLNVAAKRETSVNISTGADGAGSARDLVLQRGAGPSITLTSSGVSVAGGPLSLSTPLTVANGGTGAATLAANNVLLGNGTSALQVVAPGTSGNVLTSNGTTWTSAAPANPNALRRITTFTASGTWTKNADTASVLVVVVGAGGGSGSCSPGAGTCTAGGGAGGGTAIKRIAAASLGATETVTVGAGGTAGSAGGNGGTGGTSSFGAHCSATGGAGSLGNSTANTTTFGGAGGSGSGGDINLVGSDGSTGQINSTAAQSTSGDGGASQFGGSAGPVKPSTAGVAGKNYGGGASGSASTSSNIAGGAGAGGLVIVYEYA